MTSELLFPSTPGIYAIWLVDTEGTERKVYIGSTINIRKRVHQHRNDLRRKNHGNQRLQNAWNKYGESFFRFEVLENVDLNDIPVDEVDSFLRRDREQYWIDELKNELGDKFLMNICPTAGSQLGKTHSDETRAKLSAAKKKFLSENPNPWSGKKHSEAARVKQAAAKIGRPPSNKGYRFSDEVCAKMSAGKRARSGNPLPRGICIENGRYRVQFSGMNLGRYNSLDEAIEIHRMATDDVASVLMDIEKKREIRSLAKAARKIELERRRVVKAESKSLRQEQLSASVPCSCGCGESLCPFDSRGRSRRFIPGHHRKLIVIKADIFRAPVLKSAS